MYLDYFLSNGFDKEMIQNYQFLILTKLYYVEFYFLVGNLRFYAIRNSSCYFAYSPKSRGMFFGLTQWNRKPVYEKCINIAEYFDTVWYVFTNKVIGENY